MTKSIFATVVNCIDGRVQIPVINFIRSKTGVDYVDVITEAGVAKLLANNENLSVLQSIKERIRVSIEKHSSKSIWVTAHHDCAANNVDEATQIHQVLEAAELISKWFPQADVSGLWVDRDTRVLEIERGRSRT